MKLYRKCKRFPLGAIRPEGFLRDQLIRSRDGMGGHLDELEPGMIADPFLRKTFVPQWQNGDQEGWGAEISGNYWSGAIQLAYTLHDEGMIQKVTAWVNQMLKNQKEDGYLGTYRYEDSDIYDDYNAWGSACCYRGLLAYYEATGRKDVLDAVHRSLLWFCDKWAGEHKTVYGGQDIIEVMILCYEKTGDERLVAFSEEYAEYVCRHDIFDCSYKAFLKDRLFYNSNHTAGLGVKLRVPLLLYEATGKEEYLRASENRTRLVRKKCTHPTGGPVSVSEYLGPVSPVTETEYCSFAFYNVSYSYMSAVTGEAKYGDYMEEIFYNGAQGARKKDEKAIAYLSAPNQTYARKASSFTFSDYHLYAPCFPVSCCPVTSVLLLPEFVRGMMLTDDEDSLYLTAYGPASLDSGNIRVTEETGYPFRDVVSLRFREKGNYKVYFKIPAWCRKYEITVNGKPADVSADENGYAMVGSSWKKNDVAAIRFFPEIEVLHVDDSDASGKRPLAFRRGALIYSYHILENWIPIPGRPATPLPEGWSWYEIRPVYREADVKDPHEQIGLRRYQYTWNVAVDEKITPDEIRFEELDADGYAWENPRTCLKLKAYRAPYFTATYESRTFEGWGQKQYVTDPVDLTLVPYGCTNLRVTYFARADLDGEKSE